MFRIYLKTLVRTLKKNKLATAINVVGLTIAFACALLLLLRVYDEFSFDKAYADKERIFKVYNFGNAPEGERLSSSMPLPLQAAIKAEQVGVERAALMNSGSGQGIRYNGKTLALGTSLVGADFLDIFSLPVRQGNRQNALSGTGNLVLTSQAAEGVFGKEDPIGKRVEVNIGGQWTSLTVSAVLENIPRNSSLGFDMLARIELFPDYAAGANRWDWWNSSLYVKIQAGASQKTVEAALRQLVAKYYLGTIADVKKMGYKQDAQGDYIGLRLLPADAFHFDTQVGAPDAINKSFLYVLLLVSCSILLIACFNFVNLNIGISFTRTKEIGIRKCLGAQRKQVWLQVWSESVFLILVSMIAGVGCALLFLKKFNQVFGAGIEASLLGHPLVILALFLLVLVISLLASGYPSAVMASLKITEVLKGKFSMKGKSVLRNGLIVLQFVIAIVLISATLVVFRQFQYLRKAPLGYDTNALISIPVKQADKVTHTIAKMRAILAAQPSVISISGSSINFGVGMDGGTNKHGMGFEFEGKQVRTNLLSADYDIVKTLGVALKQGRDFSGTYASDTANNVIITESMAAQLGVKDPVGVSFVADSAEAPWTVVGVISDFQLYSMYNKREPLTIRMDPADPVNYLLVRVVTQNPSATMDLVKKAYREAEPGGDFNGSYVNENVDRWYRSEQQLAKMFMAAAAVAIILSCMGLFGMAFIVVGQRTKEIGVRKVLGAPVHNIAILISKEFIKPVVIAILIASPIALWALNKWLQHFTYRVPLTWWVFAAAGSLAVLIAVITVSVQAIRAAIVNPVKSLRTE